ncbi:hypothetical protein BH24ACT26_BH24ACT26_18040 [soil metagenome]
MSPVRETPSSWFTIISVFVIELAIAAMLVFSVGQGYIAYECGDAAYRSEHPEQCRGGFPYPLL